MVVVVSIKQFEHHVKFLKRVLPVRALTQRLEGRAYILMKVTAGVCRMSTPERQPSHSIVAFPSPAMLRQESSAEVPFPFFKLRIQAVDDFVQVCYSIFPKADALV